MPIRVPDNLPALDDLTAEGVDLVASGQATKQDIRPLRLIMLNLMPTKKTTEIQFARLFGCSPLQVELILMTTESYTPKNTEPAYLRRFYRRLSDVEGEFFDALIVTGAPIETKPFEEVSYWQELVDIFNWSKTHCFRRLGICWGLKIIQCGTCSVQNFSLRKNIIKNPMLKLRALHRAPNRCASDISQQIFMIMQQCI